MLHHPYDSLHNVIHVGKVPLAVAVVEDLNLFAFQQLIGETKVGHVGTTGGAIDSEEAEAGAGDIVQFRVGMSHQLIALLGSGIEADGIIHLVIGRLRYLLIATIN